MGYRTHVFETFKRLETILSPIGNAQYRSLFFGLSITINDVVIGVITEDLTILIRGTPSTIQNISDLKLPMYYYSKRGVDIRSGYYQLHEHQCNNSDTLLKLFESAYTGQKEVIRANAIAKDASLSQMPNIRSSLARKLREIDIHFPSDLRDTGAVVAFSLLRKQYGSLISESILFKLEAAIRGVHVATLQTSEKSELKNSYAKYYVNYSFNMFLGTCSET